MPGKSQIADRIAARGASRVAAAAAVEAVLDEITTALAAGERVTLTGFGTFEATARAARTGRNPRTGEPLEVAATTVARFHPGATLRAQVAAGTGEPLGDIADLSTLQGLAAPERAAVVAPPATAPKPKLKPSGTSSANAGASAKAKAKAEAKKADVKKRADAAKKADAKKRVEAKKKDAKKKDAKNKADTKSKKKSGKGHAKKK